MSTSANVDEAGEEKRRWHRHQFTVPVRVTIEQPRHATLVDTRASQVNDGGITMYTNAELSLGTLGVVRNRAGNKYGLEFLVTSAAENEHLTIFREILHSKLGRTDRLGKNKWG